MLLYLPKCGVARIENALAALALIFKRADVRRQQAVQAEDVAFLLGERSALVEARIEQEIDAMKAGANDRLFIGSMAGADCGVSLT